MGIFLTDMADVLRGAGLEVIEHPGWKSNGFRTKTTPDGGLIALRGGVTHHTATSSAAMGNYPTYNTIVHGRGGASPVPGPLSQLGIGRDGTWYCFAAGRANHAGAADKLEYSNPFSIGVEAEHPGSGGWNPKQYASYVRGARALSRRYSIVWRGHKEIAIPLGRKTDPNFDMDDFRSDVTRTNLPGDDMYSDNDRYRDNLVLAAAGRMEAKLWAMGKAMDGFKDVNEEAIIAGVLRGLTPEKIADLLGDALGASVADTIAERLRTKG